MKGSNWIGICAALSLAGTVVMDFSAAHAARAGVAAAVNTHTQGTPPGGAVRQIVLGQDVLHNETITTDENGQAQILMLDRTALTIGPNSTLVIDKFIYDPASKSGEMGLTLRRGLLRFTGGALSKKKPVNVRTPVATVGIRGGMGLIEVASDEETSAGFLFGEEMTVLIDGALAEQFGRPGFGTTIRDGKASSPSRWGSKRIGALMARLQGRAGSNGGLPRPPGAGQTNQAAGDALPGQDGQVLNRVIKTAFGSTTPFNQEKLNQITNAVNQNRQFNDLIEPEEPRRGRHGEGGGNHWERRFELVWGDFLRENFDTLDLLVEHLPQELRDQLTQAGYTGREVHIDQLKEVYREFRKIVGRPNPRRGRGSSGGLVTISDIPNVSIELPEIVYLTE